MTAEKNGQLVLHGLDDFTCSLFPLIWHTAAIYQGTFFFFFDAAVATMLNLDSTYQTPGCQFRRTTLYKGKLTEYVHTNIRHKGSNPRRS